MLTWLILGYLMASLLTFLFVYSAYIVAAQADQRQEQDMVLYRGTQKSFGRGDFWPTTAGGVVQNFSGKL